MKAFAFEKPDEPSAASQLAQQLPSLHLHSLPLERPRSARTYLESWLAGRPLSVHRNHSRAAKQVIDVLSADADVILVDHYLMYQYVPAWYQGRVVVHTHNAEHSLWKRYSSECSAPLKRLLVSVESARIKRCERRMVLEASAVLASPNDAHNFLSLGCPRGKLYSTLHLGDDENLKKPDLQWQETRPVVLFVGTLTWEANVDGLLWFVQHIWPSVLASHPEAEFWVVGKAKSDSSLTKTLAKVPNLRYLGFVEDLEPLYRQTRVFVAPLRFGAGTKVKVVNALYRGIPAVTTTCGVDGLGCDSLSALRVADDPRRFGEEVIQLLSDEIKWTRTLCAARRFASEKLSWSHVLSEVDGAIENAAAN